MIDGLLLIFVVVVVACIEVDTQEMIDVRAGIRVGQFHFCGEFFNALVVNCIQLWL